MSRNTFLLAVSACATLGPEDVKYYVNSRKNCSLSKCRINKDETMVCPAFIQTKYIDKNEIFIRFGSEFVTNGTLMLNANDYDIMDCFKKRNDYNRVGTKALIDKKLEKIRKTWEWEEQLELDEKKRFEELQEKREKEEAKQKAEKEAKEAEKIKNEKLKIAKSRRIVENELKKENLTKSNIYLILREIDIQPEKDEFETTAEFNKRREAFLKDVRKKYPKLVFKKELVTEYDADNKILDVFVPTSYCPENYNETCVDIETTSSESKYVGKNAFNVEKLVTTYTSDTYGVMLATNFSDVEGFNKKQYDKKVFQDFISLRNISAKTAKKLSENTALVIVGKLKNIERASKSSYTEPTINTPMEWRSSSAYINVSTTGICIANMLTKKCLVTFKAD